jgi:hypothetical protein
MFLKFLFSLTRLYNAVYNPYFENSLLHFMPDTDTYILKR